MNILHTTYKILYKCAYKVKNIKAVYVEKKRHHDTLYLIRNNMKFKNAYRNKRCFVLGNGPSLEKVDLSLLSDEYTFAVNFAMKMDNYRKLKPTFYVWTDTSFFYNDCFSDSIALDLQKINGEGQDKPICFFSIKTRRFIEEHNLDSILNINYISHCKYFYDSCNEVIDYSRTTFDYNSVVFTAISLAIYMGFSEIYLLGCDATGIIGIINTHLGLSDTTHAYETDLTNEKILKFASQTIPIATEFYNWYRILHLYYEFNRYCKKRNIKLINCTQGSIIDSLERMNLYDVLGRKSS